MSGLVVGPTTTRTLTFSVRVIATGLLVILLLGLAIMTFTHEWIGALPNHDHLFLDDGDGPHHEHTHHAHPGDDLDLALKELVDVATPFGAVSLSPNAAPDGRPYISFNAPGVQPDLSTFTANGMIASLLLAGGLAQRGRMRVPVCIALRSRTVVPLAPPPRAV